MIFCGYRFGSGRVCHSAQAIVLLSARARIICEESGVDIVILLMESTAIG